MGLGLARIKKVYPKANYKIYETDNGCIYWNDGKTAWVKTGVIVDDLEHIEYLPIMDYKNKSIALENITSFDVNKTIQRSLTKAVARHGLGLYIYAGEDLPDNENEIETKLISQPKKIEAVAENIEIELEGIIEKCELKTSEKGMSYFKIMVDNKVFSVFKCNKLEVGDKIKTRLIRKGNFWNSLDFKVIERINKEEFIKDTNEYPDEIPF